MKEQNKQRKSGWRAAPRDLQQAFNQLALSLPEVETRQMFGCACALIHGHMFAGLHEQGVFMKLSDEGRAAAEAQLGAVAFEPMPGRASRMYVAAPPALVNQAAELMPWLEKARTYMAAVPARSKR